MSESQRQKLQEYRTRLATASNHAGIAPEGSIRAVLIGDDKDGNRFLADLALQVGS